MEGLRIKNLKAARFIELDRGSYILHIEMPVDKIITIGKLPDIHFRRGYYAYVGSAMGGVKSRLNHHLKSKKKLHWHIDYLLQKASIIDISICQTDTRTECIIAEALGSRFNAIAEFGSSDCQCRSHLFFSTKEKPINAAIEATVKSLAMP